MSWERHPVYRSKPFVISNMTFSRQRPKSVEAVRAPFHHAGFDFTGVASGPV
jgi:hypothetical protein